MLGLSTSWRSEEITEGNALLDALKESGLTALELEYRLWGPELAKVKRRLKQEFTVLSVHNPCPIPAERLYMDKPWKIAEFSALDEDERKFAVKLGIDSLRVAADFEARLVVFHFGEVIDDFILHDLYQFYYAGQIPSPQSIEFMQKIIEQRQRSVKPHLDAILRSIDELHNEAIKLGILIGAENRLYPHQMPNQDEFAIIFDEFRGGNVRYWHDVGHGEVQHRLGFLQHEQDLLQRYADDLAGMHIHDIARLTDHLTPGNGDFDFAMLTKYLRDDSIKILEVHNETAAEMQRGIEILYKTGIC